ncbi:MAG TPA: hypothetical protein VGH73_23185 [Thermoanaerobaculia bacterium]|jgi:hypothetical protein
MKRALFVRGQAGSGNPPAIRVGCAGWSLPRAAQSRFAAAGREVWCIFDNTTLGAATHNALDLRSRQLPGPG